MKKTLPKDHPLGQTLIYAPPKLLKIGNISKITLKTGSISDFGGNRYTP